MTSEPRILVTLDSVAYRSKPDGKFGAITTRLQRTRPVEIGAKVFCEHVRAGKCWTGYLGGGRSGFTGGDFDGLQVMALDFDNAEDTGEKDADGRAIKRYLRKGEAGYMSPLGALDRLESLGIAPLCLYATFNSKPENMRFRVVVALDSPKRAEVASKAVFALLKAFPEADRKCSNLNRIYAGSNGDVQQTWLSWGR